jgi:hypothetical protein
MQSETANVRDKRTKFLELANKRVNRAIKAMELVANLGNRKNYQYTDEEARKILKTLQSELDGVKRAYLLDAQAGKTKFEI